MSSSASRTTPLTAAEAIDLITGMAPVDRVRLEQRATALMRRQSEPGGEVGSFELALRLMDLTSLAEEDTEEKVSTMCRVALRPDADDPSLPSVAAVCVLPAFVPTAVQALHGSGVRVAAVAGGFPTGMAPTGDKLREIREVVEMGAEEVDVVMNRASFLAGDLQKTFQELAACKEACGEARLKVIVESGALSSYDEVRKASVLAMAAGADFIKTSTGTIRPGATHPTALCIIDAIRDFHAETGGKVGIKVAGGIRTARQARGYLLLVDETLGPEWLSPDRFRIGASALLGDLLSEIRKERSWGTDPVSPKTVEGRRA
jgi:deoxyribose-phosphate aldolase